MYPREYFDTFWRGDLRNEVFVAMSFAAEFDTVWTDSIRPAIENDTQDNPVAHRVDTSTLSGNIITEILDGIAHAKLVFVDISICNSGTWARQRNGNVMYELGLAHAIRQSSEIVAVRSDNEMINFDIVGIRIQRYDLIDVSTTRNQFAQLLNGSLNIIDNTRGLKIQEAIERLDADSLTLISSHAQDQYFSTEISTTMSEAINVMALGTKNAVRNLLELKMIRCDANMSQSRYAYHWTNFGVNVLQAMNART